MPKSGAAGSYGSSIFSFLRNLHSVLYQFTFPPTVGQETSGESRRVPFSPYLLQHLFFVDFFMITILIEGDTSL